MRIFLVGNPNVGKSVVFQRLTGLYAIASNYPGTTVELATGRIRVGKGIAQVTDLPGTYSLEPTSEAEKVTAKMLNGLAKDDIIVNVLDSTNLERSLGLSLQLVELRRPMIIALNLWDEALHTGTKINVKLLEEMLGLSCLPLVALTGEGVKALVDSLPRARVSGFEFDSVRRWDEVGNIIKRVQVITHRHHTLLDRLGDASLRPFTGIVIALCVLGMSFEAIRLIGEGLIRWMFEPIFEGIWSPLMLRLSGLLGGSGFLHALLIGNLVNGGIDYKQAFGLLTTGLFVPFGAVLPYVFAFYLVLSWLEDCGYLPRLAVIADRFMHTVGLHGLGIVPMLLGLGCNVPGALAGRIMESARERFIGMTLMAIAVPCMAQVAMIIALAGSYGAPALALIFGTLAALWLALGMILKRTMKGESTELLLDVPPYRVPFLRGLAQKVGMRLASFVAEAVPLVLVGVLLINLLYYFKVIDAVGRFASPVVVSLLGLPAESAGSLAVGFLRKDVAVGMLTPLHLSFRQTIVASVVLAIYFPCAATFAVIFRELGILGTSKATAIMVATVLTVGGSLNLVLRLMGY
jgi:ferrous iron transport protein B